MAAGKEEDQENHNDEGKSLEYLLTRDENQILLNILYLDLDQICLAIEDNLRKDDKTSS